MMPCVESIRRVAEIPSAPIPTQVSARSAVARVVKLETTTAVCPIRIIICVSLLISKLHQTRTMKWRTGAVEPALHRDIMIVGEIFADVRRVETAIQAREGSAYFPVNYDVRIIFCYTAKRAPSQFPGTVNHIASRKVHQRNRVGIHFRWQNHINPSSLPSL